MSTDAVLAYLAAQEAALRAGERALRAGDPAAVHPTRVGARRARSTLRTFGPLFAPAPRDAAVRSLREYAASLGTVRDLQVLRAVLEEAAPDPLAAWAVDEVTVALAARWARLERELTGPRPRRAPDLTAALTVDPGRAVDLHRYVKKAGKKAKRRLRRAGDDVDRLHEARKAAKRARYAAEATGAAARAARFEEVQDGLGRHRDLLTAAAWLDTASPPASLRPDAVGLAAALRADAARVRAGVVL